MAASPGKVRGWWFAVGGRILRCGPSHYSLFPEISHRPDHKGQGIRLRPLSIPSARFHTTGCLSFFFCISFLLQPSPRFRHLRHLAALRGHEVGDPRGGSSGQHLPGTGARRSARPGSSPAGPCSSTRCTEIARTGREGICRSTRWLHAWTCSMPWRRRPSPYAGAVHAHVQVPGGLARYLADLKFVFFRVPIR